jgi:hypothetical protein
MSRTIEALRLVVEKLDEHEKELACHKKELKVLTRQVRNLEIRDRVLVSKEKQNDVAKLYNLSAARVNQLSKCSH